MGREGRACIRHNLKLCLMQARPSRPESTSKNDASGIMELNFFTQNYASKGYVDVATPSSTFRFRVLDDGAAGSKLTAEKVQEIILQLVKDQTVTLSRFTSSRSITVEKSDQFIKDVHAPIVLYMTNRSSSFVTQILKFLRKYILEPLFGKKSTLSTHIALEFRKLIEGLPVYLQKKILHDLRVTQAEFCFLEHLGAIISKYPDSEKLEVVKHALHGAYIQIEDGGRFYDEWVRTVHPKKSRHSTHASSASQYSFQGPLCKECLFSKKWVEDAQGAREVSWFQLERYPVERAWLFAHFFSWVVYKFTGENQGPHGTSEHTEANPIVLPF